MNDMSPQGMFTDTFNQDEVDFGRPANEMLPKQYALIKLEAAEYRRSQNEKDTPGIHYRFRCDDVDALSPKRSEYDDVYLSKGAWFQAKRICVATGLGMPTVDPEAMTKDQMDSFGKTLAAMLVDKVVIARIGQEMAGAKSKKDRNRILAMFPVTEENLAAIREAKYEDAMVGTHEVKDQAGKLVRVHLVLKKKGVNVGKAVANATTAVGGAPGAFD